LAEDGRFRRWFHEQLGLPAGDHDALQGKLPPEAAQAAPKPPGDEGKTAPQTADNPAQGGAATKASKQQSGGPQLQGQDPSAADKQAIDELNTKRPNPGLSGTPEPQVGAPSISEQLSNNVNATLVAQDMSGQVTVQPGTHALVGSRNYADCVAVSFRGIGKGGASVVGVAHYSCELDIAVQVKNVSDLLKSLAKIEGVTQWDVVITSSSKSDIHDVQKSGKTGLEEINAGKPGNVNLAVTPQKTQGHQNVYTTPTGVIVEQWDGGPQAGKDSKLRFYPFPNQSPMSPDQMP